MLEALVVNDLDVEVLAGIPSGFVDIYTQWRIIAQCIGII